MLATKVNGIGNLVYIAWEVLASMQNLYLQFLDLHEHVLKA